MSPSDTDFLGRPPPKKSKKGEIRALFSVGDFPIDANSSLVEGLPKALERLLEILNDLADWLGLRAHTLLSLEVPPEQR